MRLKKALLLPVGAAVILLLAAAPQVFSQTDGGVRLSVVTGTAIGYRANDNGIYSVQNLGVLTLGAVHYDVVPYFSVWGSYGTAIKASDNVDQVVAGGIEYRDFIHVTSFVGCELGAGTDMYGYYDPWFVGVGLAIEGIEIDLTDILSGESLE